MATKKERILFTSFAPLPFVIDDLEILGRHYDVNPVLGRWWFIMSRLLVNLFKVDLSFCWFASVSAFFVTFLSKMLHKPVVIVIGGIDVARVPELRYGAFVNPVRGQLARFTLRRADRLLLVDETLRKDISDNVGLHLKNTYVLPTGYDYRFWQPGARKENVVLTVAWCPDNTRMRLKGIDTFVKAASHIPDAKFWVVGITDQARQILVDSNLPANVSIFEPVARRELLAFYQQAKVYCQLSLREGLPNALCEAMLCNCVPVGTRMGGIPTAMADTGIYVDYGDVPMTVQAIQRALKAAAGAGRKCRDRILARFPLEKREQEIVRIIEGLDKPR